jgi:hypothetical protein
MRCFEVIIDWIKPFSFLLDSKVMSARFTIPSEVEGQAGESKGSHGISWSLV